MNYLGIMLGITLVFQGQSLISRAGELKKGQMIDRVICHSEPEQSYAVYLPTGYDPQKKWPILFCFDPAARGSLPITKFRQAAETYGFIVTGSNNSRNFVYNAAFDAINAMWKDTHQRFSIDDSRVYLAGFSGGARSSCNIANLNRSVKGVIACGAGFGGNYPPDPTRGFAFYGIVGDGDQNYLEMMQLDKTLDGFPHDHYISIFQGKHVWPPDESCFDAVAWLELHAMRDQLRPKWPEEIDRQYQKAFERAKNLESAEQWAETIRAYQAIADDFKDLVPLDEIQKKIKQLKDSPNVKNAQKAQRKRYHKENRSIDLFRQRFSRLHRMALKPSWIDKEKAWWQEQVLQLNATIRDDPDPHNRLMAERLLTLIRSTSFEETMLTLSQDDTSRAVLAGEIAATLNPENPVIHYNLACAHAKNGSIDPSIQALRQAVSLGYRDASFMEKDPDLKSLQGDTRYKDLLDSLENSTQ